MWQLWYINRTLNTFSVRTCLSKLTVRRNCLWNNWNVSSTEVLIVYVIKIKTFSFWIWYFQFSTSLFSVWIETKITCLYSRSNGFVRALPISIQLLVFYHIIWRSANQNESTSFSPGPLSPVSFSPVFEVDSMVYG